MSTIAMTASQRGCFSKTLCILAGYPSRRHREIRSQKGGIVRRVVRFPDPLDQSEVITAPPACIKSRNAARCVFVVPLILSLIKTLQSYRGRLDAALYTALPFIHFILHVLVRVKSETIETIFGMNYLFRAVI